MRPVGYPRLKRAATRSLRDPGPRVLARIHRRLSDGWQGSEFWPISPISVVKGLRQQAQTLRRSALSSYYDGGDRWSRNGRSSLAKSNRKTARTCNHAKYTYTYFACHGPLLQSSQLRDYTPHAQG